MWNLQKAAMENIEEAESDPQEQMLRDLKDEVKRLHTDGFEVLMTGDWNINKRSEEGWERWKRWCTGSGMLDIFRHIGAPAMSWAQKVADTGEIARTSWPDHMVVSESILQDGLTREAGVDELTDDFGSDHAQIATRVDFGRILGHRKAVPGTQAGINGNDTKAHGGICKAPQNKFSAKEVGRKSKGDV
jgi:hypothetical protein